jgi:hypothetical protein
MLVASFVGGRSYRLSGRCESIGGNQQRAYPGNLAHLHSPEGLIWLPRGVVGSKSSESANVLQGKSAIEQFIYKEHPLVYEGIEKSKPGVPAQDHQVKSPLPNVGFLPHLSSGIAIGSRSSPMAVPIGQTAGNA